MEGMAVEVTYGVDWHEREARLVRPLLVEEARRRHEAGEPYTVLVTAGQAPRAVLRICRDSGYVSLDLPVPDGGDPDDRGEQRYEFRELWEGRLHLFRLREWLLPESREDEDEDSEPSFSAETRPNGRARVAVESEDGGLFETWTEIPAEFRTVVFPAFGAWGGWLDAELFGASGPLVVVLPRGDEEVHATEPPSPQPAWAEPKGMRPGNLAALFTAGARLRSRDGDAEILEPEDAGLLHVPTGRIVAADPGTLSERNQPFTVAVSPGDHRVLIARMRWDEHPWSETPAAALVIRPEEPTVSWELALRPGQDVRMLGDDEFYGFGVDSGTGSFLDLATRDAVLAQEERPGSLFAFDGEKSHARWQDPGTGLNLVAYPSGHGDGSYPVWIGRGADGEVTRLVADMLVLHGAEALAPTPTDRAAFRAEAPRRLPATDAPSAGPLGEAVRHFSAVRARTVATAAEARARWLRPRF
ncbi:DUF4241 domain-containing protein [Streptacidiphilus jiangxiensis]|uniref:DUF4241 domain-containing protein n=1 Tax=Streptacidiphilus jiangxiensis TaxID=235985 RepID=A0A1H7W0H5_STRJI|nr:DUF4241 domain-containing protein [Streptacidiphilus jiangxiensis]SEM15082.1 Protein of unknown function [Streptacidiphilus jiangxiensis]